MSTTKDDLKAAFQAKKDILVAELEAWFAKETESIDGTIEKAAPAGSGGSIMGMRPAMDSKCVLDAAVVTKKLLGIEVPPEIIKPGGYNSCDEMIADIVPKLERVFIGEIKVRKRKSEKELEPV